MSRRAHPFSFARSLKSSMPRRYACSGAPGNQAER